MSKGRKRRTRGVNVSKEGVRFSDVDGTPSDLVSTRLYLTFCDSITHQVIHVNQSGLGAG